MTALGLRFGAVLAAFVLATGCAGDEPEEAAEVPQPPDCSASECASEVADLVEAVEALDGVATVEQARYVPEQTTDVAQVSGVLRIGGSDAEACADLEPELARVAWESRVAPLGAVQFQCAPEGADLSLGEYVGYSFSGAGAAEEAVEEWGPRPTGE